MTKPPSLIVTCRTSNIKQCIHEIGNVIFPQDPSILIQESSFKGVLLLYTSISPEKAYVIASNREYGYVENIIPVYCVLKNPISESELKECLSRIVKYPYVKLKVRSRGVRCVSKDVFKTTMKVLSWLNVRHDPGINICLYIEIFAGETYIGLGKCRPVYKASIN